MNYCKLYCDISFAWLSACNKVKFSTESAYYFRYKKTVFLVSVGKYGLINSIWFNNRTLQMNDYCII
jgi:hypothetical protein